MKKNKLFAIIAILAITISGVLVFQACKKGETNATPTTENTKPMPLAVKNLKTGEVKYEITAFDIQKSINDYKKSNDRYVVESVRIIENDIDHFKDGLQYTILDTDLEIASTTFMSFDFFDIQLSGDELSFFLSDEVISGNFSYTERGSDGDYLITVSNFCITNIEKLSGENKAPRPKVEVTCEGRNCITGGCTIVIDSQGLPIGCSECGKTPNEYTYCNTHVHAVGGDGGGIGFVDILSLVASLITIGSLIL